MGGKEAMDKIISNYIKYKFIFNNNKINHNSYNYQKLFRVIYGYTQNITKKDKKIYKYHRQGIIEDLPFIRPGRNCIILPINTEYKLINFFDNKIGAAHNFKEKDYYFVKYTIDKIEVNDLEIINCLEKYINNCNIISFDGKQDKLINELNKIINEPEYLNKFKKKNKDNLLDKLNNITSIDWFVKCKGKSDIVSGFLDKINLAKEKISTSLKSGLATDSVTQPKQTQQENNKLQEKQEN